MTSCPSADQLSQLLAEQLTGREREVLEAHVEACSACQQTLETLTSDVQRYAVPPRPCQREDRGLAQDLRQEFLDRLISNTPHIDQNLLAPGDSARANQEQTPATWPNVPGYEIQSLLGQGGMAVVYKARDVRLNRMVAIKMMAAGVHGDPVQRQRFQREAESAARLQHPNIVQVYEVGEKDGRPYLSLEFVDGGNLAETLNGTPQPPRQAAQLVMTLARAIHFAHQHGVVHRDLKPANILLASVVRHPSSVAEDQEGPATDIGPRTTDYGPIPKIADFGLAKQLDLNQGQTQSGAIVGTPSYMAPEQASGSTREVGPAADIYALGVILYEMLTGRPPFKAANTLETLEQIRSLEAVPPTRLQPTVPRNVETICLKALAKAPAGRYPTAKDLADDLQRFLENKPIQARRASVVEQTWRWCRRNPSLAVLTASVVLLLLLGTLGASLAAVWLKDERDLARKAEQERTEELGRSYLAQARASRLTGQAEQGFGGLKAIERVLKLVGREKLTPAQTLDLRNEAIACLATPDLRVVEQQDSGINYDNGGYTFDPLLECYTYADRKGELVIRRMADNQILAHFPSPTGAPFWYGHAGFSPDGRFFAASYEGLCVVRDLQTEKTVLSVEILRADFLPDSTAFVAQTSDGKIHMYQLPEGKEIRRLEQLERFPMGRFDPKGQRLACAREKTLYLIDVATGQVQVAFPHETKVDSFDWSADGRSLAVGCFDHRIYVYNTEERQLQAVLEGHKHVVNGVQFSPAGNLLASWSWDGTTRLWDPVTGKQWVGAAGNFLRFSKDGRRLGFRNESSFGIWEVAGGRVCRPLYHGQIGNRSPWPDYYGPYSVDFCKDGRLLVSASGDGVRLWDTGNAREVAHLPASDPAFAQFDPRGRGLVTHDQMGLHYWPMQAVLRPQSSRVRVGSPQAWHRPGDGFRPGTSWAGDGRLLAFTDAHRSRALILNVQLAEQKLVLPDRVRINHIALSPDGTWAAAAAWKDRNVKVWEVGTGQTAKMLPVPWSDHHPNEVSFSPDNRWLAVASGTDCQWWRVGSWEAGPRVPGRSPLAFSPDGRLLAINTEQHSVRLVDAATGREFATLTAPDPHPLQWLCFSPDGSQLAAATMDHLIQLWDLRLVRQELTALGLDWDQPPYPARKDTDAGNSIQVEVERGDAWLRLADRAAWLRLAGHAVDPQKAVGLCTFVLAVNPFNFQAWLFRGYAHARLEDWRRAIDDYSLALALMPPDDPGRADLLFARARSYQQLQDHAKRAADLQHALELDPDYAPECNDLARLYVTGPEKLRAPHKALPLAQKAVHLFPTSWMYQNTLGIVQYRLGQFEQAAATLERSFENFKSEATASDLFVLAMSYHHLGQASRARNCYDRAVRRQERAEPREADELNALRAEAESVLVSRD